jgi:hypothetical protein
LVTESIAVNVNENWHNWDPTYGYVITICDPGICKVYALVGTVTLVAETMPTSLVRSSISYVKLVGMTGVFV